jgi:hypothetical protein
MSNSSLPHGLNNLIYHLPYGPGLWDAIARWPNSAMSRLNTITEFVEFSCGDDWFVYVETLLPAVGNLFIVLLDFGWDDVARGFLRPAGIRSRFKFREGDGDGKKKKKKKGKGKKFEIPELGEEIGKRLPGARAIKGRKVGSLSKWFWRIDGLAQRALWYWLVIDLTIDFFYIWSTGIMKHERCWRSDSGWFQGGPGLLSWSANGNAVPAGAPLPHRSGGANPPSGVPLVIPPGRSGYVIFSLGEVGSFLGRLRDVECWLEWENGEVASRSPLVEARNLADVEPMTLLRFENPHGTSVSVRPFVRATASGPDTAIALKAFAAAKWS